MELSSSRRWRLISAQWSIKFGYCPSCTVSIVLYFHKHNSLPLDRPETSSSFSCCAPRHQRLWICWFEFPYHLEKRYINGHTVEKINRLQVAIVTLSLGQSKLQYDNINDREPFNFQVVYCHNTSAGHFHYPGGPPLTQSVQQVGRNNQNGVCWEWKCLFRMPKMC